MGGYKARLGFPFRTDPRPGHSSSAELSGLPSAGSLVHVRQALLPYLSDRPIGPLAAVLFSPLGSARAPCCLGLFGADCSIRRARSSPGHAAGTQRVDGPG